MWAWIQRQSWLRRWRAVRRQCIYNQMGKFGLERHKDKRLRVTSDPAHISHASEFVIRMNIKYVFHSQCSTQKISSCSMNHTLRFSSRSRGLKDR